MIEWRPDHTINASEYNLLHLTEYQTDEGFVAEEYEPIDDNELNDLRNGARNADGFVFSDDSSDDDEHATSVEEASDRDDDMAKDASVGVDDASIHDKVSTVFPHENQ